VSDSSSTDKIIVESSLETQFHTRSTHSPATHCRYSRSVRFLEPQTKSSSNLLSKHISTHFPHTLRPHTIGIQEVSDSLSHRQNHYRIFSQDTFPHTFHTLSGHTLQVFKKCPIPRATHKIIVESSLETQFHTLSTHSPATHYSYSRSVRFFEPQTKSSSNLLSRHISTHFPHTLRPHTIGIQEVSDSPSHTQNHRRIFSRSTIPHTFHTLPGHTL
jgi:hypothetical protein